MRDDCSPTPDAQAGHYGASQDASRRAFLKSGASLALTGGLAPRRRTAIRCCVACSHSDAFFCAAAWS